MAPMVTPGFVSPAMPIVRGMSGARIGSRLRTKSMCKEVPATPVATRQYSYKKLEDHDLYLAPEMVASVATVAAVSCHSKHKRRQKGRRGTPSTFFADGGLQRNSVANDAAWVHLVQDALSTLRFSVVNAALQWLDSFQDVDQSIQWASDLNGAFEPVKPIQEVTLAVKSGSLPPNLAGSFLRTGPNPANWPPKKRTHVFDGDGMVHTVRISGGKAVYNCAFLETERWKFEQKYGAEWYLRIGELQGLSGLAKLFLHFLCDGMLTGTPVYERGTANTGLALTPEGKLWALSESDRPFRFWLDGSGCPRSLAFDDLGGTLNESMSAHPKVDRRTGETFFHGSLPGSDFVRVSRVVDGKVTDRVEFPMRSGFHHDMFITERYVLVIDGSCAFEPDLVSEEQRPLWEFDSERQLRFGLWPRSTEKMTADAFIWIDCAEPAEIVHALHASDACDGLGGDRVILWTPLGRELKGSGGACFSDIGPLQMHRIVIDVTTKSVEIQSVLGSELRTEFPRIRDDGVARNIRYGYSGLQAQGECDFEFVGILKWDLQEGGLAHTIRFPAGVIGGEPVFIPASASGWRESAEDEGYIGMFLWDSRRRESSYVLYDAQTMSSEPVVELRVPRRVPLGFHGLWINEEEFRRQAAMRVVA